MVGQSAGGDGMVGKSDVDDGQSVGGEVPSDGPIRAGHGVVNQSKARHGMVDQSQIRHRTMS